MNTAYKEGGGLHLERSGLYYGTLVVSLQGPPTDIGVDWRLTIELVEN